jgi:hypothetical protein
MGSVGLQLDTRRIGEGDVTELFYALKEKLLDCTWDLCGEMPGLGDYLSSEDLHTWMGDRFEPHEGYLWFAFWEEGIDEGVCEFAMHCAAHGLTAHRDEVHELAARHGFAITLDWRFELDHLSRGSWVIHEGFPCQVQPWRRGTPISDEPTFACANPGWMHQGSCFAIAEPELSIMRASAMTGFCACDACVAARPDLLTAEIVRAWALLDGDPRGVALAGDPVAGDVFGDWLEERGVVLASVQRDALAATYRA